MAVSDGARFDFIIVGGGTAGNTVAGRLAENPRVRILVVEAGVGEAEDMEAITTPSAAMDLRGSEHDWGYKTTLVARDDYERVEQPNTRGKVLGGSSSLNYFTWIPGCKPTFDRWSAYGGDDWAWDPLLPYLRKSASYHDDEGLYPPELAKLGRDGSLPISHARLLDHMAPFRDALTAAWTSCGEPVSEDVYDGTMAGLTHCVDTIYRGRRSASFLCLRDKPNITVLAQARATRLVIDYADRTCSGVRVVDSCGRHLTLYATRELILSLGVFETPKLLMLSSIGPQRDLSRHGIDVVVDSRHVGQHLLDHPAVPFVLRLKDGYGMDPYLLHDGPDKTAAADAYRESQSGPAASGLLELVAFPRIDKYLDKVPEYCDAKAANHGRDPISPEGQPHFELDFVCLFGSAFQWHFPLPKHGCYTTVVVDLVRPLSPGGHVTLRSSDPLVQPDINLNFFADDLDIVAMREGIRFAYHVLTHGDEFSSLVLDEYPWQMPLDSDKDMKRAVLDRCQTAFHPCGTARLSRSMDQGVVDPRLRVHGIANLRVIDASIIPVIPDCRIQNSVYMVAEKGADMIKADHGDLYD